MKNIPFFIFISTLIASTAFVHSQTESGTGVSPASPSTTTARIIGTIRDGTPPPPPPPKPEYHIASRDVLSTKTHQQGGRTITVREIKPINLPQPPAPVEVTPNALDNSFIEQMRAYHATHPRPELLCLGATVFLSANHPPRTLVRYWSIDHKSQITFWSSADFSLIAGGISSFIDTTGADHSIFMSWSHMDADLVSKVYAAQNRVYQKPEIPAFPEGKATFQIIGAAPAAEELIAIQSLHDIYNSELPHLQTAYQSREQARLQREAYLKANPPQPKDITLNYWRTEKPATTNKKGANQ